MSWLTKPARVKAAVVVAVTAVEGGAVTGVEVVAEDATNNSLIVAAVPLPVVRMCPPDSGGSALRHLACHRQQQLPVSFLGMTQGFAHVHQKSSIRSIETE